jgi:flagellar protein FliS
MMMEAVLTRLSSAAEAINSQNVAAKGEAIGLAVSIIAALQNSLDHERGGEIADNLDRLYDYMLRQLVQANADNDLATLTEVQRLMSEVKSGWDAIPQALEQRAAS